MKCNFSLIFNTLLDFIYKRKCYFCHSSNECVAMCSDCYSEMIQSDLKLNRVIDGVEVYSAGVYEKYIQKLIRGIKYHRQKDLAFYMAKFMWEYFSQIIEKYNLGETFQIVPVPLHKSRQRQRGYNHMELVANELSKLSGYYLNTELVKRVKNTKPQYKLPYSKKFENLKGAFEVNLEKLLNCPVLLIDDICTSGATFSALINELKKCGIDKIVCLSMSSPEN